MKRKDKRLSLFAPVAIFATTWFVRKSFLKTRKVVDNKRATIENKEKEDTLWQIGLTLAVAISEVLITTLMSRDRHDSKSEPEATSAGELPRT